MMKIIRDFEAFIGALREKLEVFGPPGKALLAELIMDAQKAGIIEDAVLETVEDAHALIDGMKDAPEYLRALAKAGQANADKALLGIGHFGAVGVKVNALLGDLREGRLKVVTETRIVKT